MASLVVCGAINWDITCFVEKLPSPGEEVPVRRVQRVSGGTAGNVAVAAARILGRGAVALLGALGDDDIGSQQIAALEAEGVVTDGIRKVSGMHSGQAYILVDDRGENIIATSLGANAALRAMGLIARDIDRLLHGCRAIAITDPPLEVVEALVLLAQERGIPSLWDPGVLLADHSGALSSMTCRVDTLFCNEVEAAALFNSTEPDVVLKHVSRLGFRNQVVMKLGSRGAALLEPATRKVVETPALPLDRLGMQVVGTVGCGDAFVGAFAAYRILEADSAKALLMASVAAGLNATRQETRGSPDRATLEMVQQRACKIGYSLRRRSASE